MMGVLLTAQETLRDAALQCTSLLAAPPSPRLPPPTKSPKHSRGWGGPRVLEGSFSSMHPAQSHTDKGWEKVGGTTVLNVNYYYFSFSNAFCVLLTDYENKNAFPTGLGYSFPSVPQIL